jgi:hypothetical protein
MFSKSKLNYFAGGSVLAMTGGLALLVGLELGFAAGLRAFFGIALGAAGTFMVLKTRLLILKKVGVILAICAVTMAWICPPEKPSIDWIKRDAIVVSAHWPATTDTDYLYRPTQAKDAAWRAVTLSKSWSQAPDAKNYRAEQIMIYFNTENPSEASFDSHPGWGHVLAKPTATRIRLSPDGYSNIRVENPLLGGAPTYLVTSQGAQIAWYPTGVAISVWVNPSKPSEIEDHPVTMDFDQSARYWFIALECLLFASGAIFLAKGRQWLAKKPIAETSSPEDPSTLRQKPSV